MMASRLASVHARASGRRVLESSVKSRCCFCSASSTGAPRNTKQRRRRQGNAPTRPPSKRDRIRSLEPKPEPEFKLPTAIDVERIGDRVETRLTEVQQYIFSFWRGGENASPRPARVGPVMDEKWWFWNLLLMSLPATLFGLYCEFIAKPDMERMLGQVDAEQRAKILGDVFLTEEKQETADIPSEPLPSMTEQDKKKAQVIVDELESEESLSLLSLKRRLDALESELRTKDRQLEHLRKYQLTRSQQSGIHNRVEDQMVEKWKSQELNNREEAPVDDTNLTERIKEAIVHRLGEILLTKTKSLENFGKDIMHRARDLISGDHNKDSTTVTLDESARDGDDDKLKNDQAIAAVNEATTQTNRAAEIVLSSLDSTDPQVVAQAAEEAASLAKEASRSAEKASDAMISPRHEESLLQRQWKSWFRIKERANGEAKPQF